MKHSKLLLLILFITKLSFATSFPVLSNFEIHSDEPSKIYFESSEVIIGSTSTGFNLRDREGRTIIGITIHSNQLTGHYFTVSTPFSWYHNNTLKYDGGSDIQGTSAPLPNINLQYIKNNIPIPNFSGTEYYSDVSVGSSGDGLSEANAFKTIQEGINQLTNAGDKLWIKAGDYGNEQIYFPTHEVNGEWVGYQGTVEAPFFIEGYKNIPGDITDIYYSYGDGALDADEMPLLDGGSNGAALEYVGINLGDFQEYYVLKNIQIQNYHEGILAGKDLNRFRLENILLKDIGELGLDYGGRGIALESWDDYRCHYIRVKNCVVIDAENDGILSQGDNNFYDNCKVYSQATDGDPWNNSRVGTDYYFRFELGNNNIMRNCFAFKDRKYGHVGHAFSNKKATENNLVEFCTAVNIIWSFQARHSASKFNVFRNCEAHANTANRRREQFNSYSGGINVMCGANNNIFERIYIHDVDLGFDFYKNSEDNANSSDIAHDNIFKNIIIDNIVHNVFNIYNSEDIPASFNDNKFYNLTINKINFEEPPVDEYEYDEGAIQGGFFLWNPDGLAPSSGNEIKNTTITDCPNISVYSTLPGGFDWGNNNFFNSFTPQGVNTFSVDPLFVNLSGNDYHLQEDSPLIDEGEVLTEVIFDYEGNLRPFADIYDIGAYEYTSATTVSSLNILTKNSLSIYPNPSTGIFMLHFPKLKGKSMIYLFSLDGKLIYTDETTENTGSAILDLSQVVKGTYFIRITNQRSNCIDKIILY